MNGGGVTAGLPPPMWTRPEPKVRGSVLGGGPDLSLWCAHEQTPPKKQVSREEGQFTAKVHVDQCDATVMWCKVRQLSGFGRGGLHLDVDDSARWVAIAHNDNCNEASWWKYRKIHVIVRI